MPRRWCWRRGGPGRPMKPRFLSSVPSPTMFVPWVPGGGPMPTKEPIYLSYDEYESLRLTYIEGLNQEEVAERMKISRGTVWRCLESARNKLVRMMVERRPLIIADKPPQPPEGPST
ncbi:MAG: DUF134 domain-containing protein [Candidatus Hadarchaeum sp.]|uniref:DUF134 domain-containing protein n=2 Tax=Candidatus Hadarchaeum sp. TaxID=2883567 RepID=UPI003175D045